MATSAVSPQQFRFGRLKQLVHSVHSTHSAKEGQSYLFFLDKNGEVEVVSEKIDPETGEWADPLLLHEAARAVSGGPYFEILSIVEGRITVWPGVREILGEPSDEELQAALNEAWMQRQQFYQERVAEYGPSAYPRQSVVELNE